jgi:hypothetical protein
MYKCSRILVGANCSMLKSVDKFTFTMETRVYHPCYELEFHDWRGALDTTLCDGYRSGVSLGTPFSSTK